MEVAAPQAAPTPALAVPMDVDAQAGDENANASVCNVQPAPAVIKAQKSASGAAPDVAVTTVPSKAVSAGGSRVRVAVRVRPLLASLESGQRQVVHSQGRSIQMGDKKPFTYDHVFDQSSSQEDLYGNAVRDMVADCVSGYNVTFLAYGQTGSGKTFTMGTSHEVLQSKDLSDSTMGLVPRCVADLFATLEQSGRRWRLSCSMLELYNEQLHDLLNPGAENVRIREVNGQVSVTNLHEISCSQPHDVLECLSRGSVHRAVGATNMNHESSRSHMVCTLHVEQFASDSSCEVDGADTQADEDASNRPSITSTMTFVDLAGSERLKRTGATGARRKEGISINKGLLALGNVINALGDDSRAKPAAHVPYRDSKLTRMLQEALGGNSRTLFIACVSPAASNFEETLNTLRYANRARNIQNSATVNRSKHQIQIMRLEAINRAFAVELVRARFCSEDNASDEAVELLMGSDKVKNFLAEVAARAVDTEEITHQLQNLPLSTTSRAGMGSQSTARGATVHDAAPVPIFCHSRGRSNSASSNTSQDGAGVSLGASASVATGAGAGATTESAEGAEGELALVDREIHQTQIEIMEQEHKTQMEEDGEQCAQIDSELQQKELTLKSIREKLVDHARLQVEQRQLKQQLADIEADRNRLEGELKTAQEKKDIKLVAKLRERVNALKERSKRVRQAEQQNKEALTRMKSEQNRATRLEKSIADLKREKMKLMKAQSKRQKEHQRQILEKKKALLASQKKLRNVSRQLNRHNMRQRSSQVKLERARRQISELKQKQLTLLRDVKRMRDRRSKRRRGRFNRRARVPRSRTAVVTVPKPAQDTVECMREYHIRTEVELRKLDDREAEAVRQLAQLTDELIAAIQGGDDQGAESLSMQIREIEDDLIGIREDIVQLRKESELTHQKTESEAVQKLNLEIIEAQAELCELQEQNSVAKDTVAEKERKMQELESTNEGMAEEIRRLQAQLASRDSNVQVLERELVHLRSQSTGGADEASHASTRGEQSAGQKRKADIVTGGNVQAAAIESSRKRPRPQGRHRRAVSEENIKTQHFSRESLFTAQQQEDSPNAMRKSVYRLHDKCTSKESERFAKALHRLNREKKQKIKQLGEEDERHQRQRKGLDHKGTRLGRSEMKKEGDRHLRLGQMAAKANVPKSPAPFAH